MLYLEEEDVNFPELVKSMLRIVDNKYCDGCRQTTRHTLTFETAVCRRCGRIKLIKRITLTQCSTPAKSLTPLD